LPVAAVPLPQVLPSALAPLFWPELPVRPLVLVLQPVHR
jgi:hypothetical protein